MRWWGRGSLRRFGGPPTSQSTDQWRVVDLKRWSQNSEHKKRGRCSTFRLASGIDRRVSDSVACQPRGPLQRSIRTQI